MCKPLTELLKEIYGPQQLELRDASVVAVLLYFGSRAHNVSTCAALRW